MVKFRVTNKNMLRFLKINISTWENMCIEEPFTQRNLKILYLILRCVDNVSQNFWTRLIGRFSKCFPAFFFHCSIGKSSTLVRQSEVALYLMHVINCFWLVDIYVLFVGGHCREQIMVHSLCKWYSAFVFWICSKTVKHPMFCQPVLIVFYRVLIITWRTSCNPT